MNRITTRTLAACAVVACAALAPLSQVNAASVNGYYVTLSSAHPDVQNGIDGGVTPGLVQAALGPNGLPVVSTPAYGGPSGPITDVNPVTGELLWWTPGRGIVQFEKVQVDPVPFSFTSNFFPDGQGSNAAAFRAVRWQGAFSLAAPKSVTFTLAADDDAWLFINSQLFVDDGGVKGLTTHSNTAVFAAGNYTIDLFFADRHQVQSGVSFTSSEELTSVIPVPGALPLLASGLLMFGLGARRRIARC